MSTVNTEYTVFHDAVELMLSVLKDLRWIPNVKDICDASDEKTRKELANGVSRNAGAAEVKIGKAVHLLTGKFPHELRES